MWRRGLWGVVRVSAVVGFVLITSTLEFLLFLFLFIARGVLRIIRLLLLTIIPSFAFIFCIYLGFAYFYLVLPCETLTFFIPGAMGINGVNASFHINIYMIS